MEVFSVQEWETRFDELIERVEKGEHIGVVREDGKSAVFLPADDPILSLYTEHNEASQVTVYSLDFIILTLV